MVLITLREEDPHNPTPHTPHPGLVYWAYIIPPTLRTYLQWTSTRIVFQWCDIGWFGRYILLSVYTSVSCYVRWSCGLTDRLRHESLHFIVSLLQDTEHGRVHVIMLFVQFCCYPRSNHDKTSLWRNSTRQKKPCVMISTQNWTVAHIPQWTKSICHNVPICNRNVHACACNSIYWLEFFIQYQYIHLIIF